jgi:hypothetical protein
MNLKEAEILILEDRISDLEFTILERSAAEALAKVLPRGKQRAATAPAKWTLRSILQPDGTERHELRSATGSFTTLPDDKSLWPEAVRLAEAKFLELDRKRSVNGRLLSNFKQPA